MPRHLRPLFLLLLAFGVPAPAVAGVAPGELDPTFASAGVLSQQIGLGATPASEAIAAAALPGGGGVTAGRATDEGGADIIAVTRATSAGAFDGAFGGAGVARLQLGLGGSPASAVGSHGLAAQGDGRVLLAGGATDAGGAEAFAVARLTTAGSLDPSFAGGRIVTQLGQGPAPLTSGAEAIAVDPAGGGATVAVVQRYTADGLLDADFGSGGTYRNQFAAGSDGQSRATDLALLPDGGIAVALSLDEDGDTAFGVARLTASGQLDTSFGSMGAALVTVAAAPAAPVAASVAPTPGGGVAVSGFDVDGGGQPAFAAALLTSTGAFDPTFGADRSGVVVRQLSPAAPPVSQALDIGVQANRDVVLVGSASGLTGDRELAIARFRPDGSFDSGLAGTGVVERQLGDAPSADSQAMAAQIAPNGTLTVAGSGGSATAPAWLLARFVLALPPSVTIAVPTTPTTVGQAVTLTATAIDPAGIVTRIDWDTDGDGVFGDAQGQAVSASFPTVGTVTVSARATDDDALSGVATGAVTVVAAAPAHVPTPAPVPVVRSLKLRPSSFRNVGTRTSASPRTLPAAHRPLAPLGATVSYETSSAGTVLFSAERISAGRRVHGSCVAVSSGNRSGPVCTRVTRLPGGFARASSARLNHFRFRGAIGGHRLARGSYRLVVVGRDPAGKHPSAPVRARFSIVRR